MRTSHRSISQIVAAMPLVLSIAATGVARADVFVTNWNAGTVGEYTNAGVSVNPALVGSLNNPGPVAISGSSLLAVSFSSGTLGAYQLGTPGTVVTSNATMITGLAAPRGIAVSGSTFYVTSWTTANNGRVGKYTLSTPVTLGASNPTFLSGLFGGPNGVGISGNRLFVENETSGVVAEYDATSGAAVNASLLTIPGSQAIAVDGADMYIASYNGGSFTIGKYLLGGTPGTISTVNASLISGTGGPMALAVSGTDLYITSFAGNTISRYTTSGALVNASLVTNLDGSVGLAATPEPSSLSLLGLGVAGLLLRRRK